jgi:hypothetical protein
MTRLDSRFAATADLGRLRTFHHFSFISTSTAYQALLLSWQFPACAAISIGSNVVHLHGDDSFTFSSAASSFDRQPGEYPAATAMPGTAAAASASLAARKAPHRRSCTAAMFAISSYASTAIIGGHHGSEQTFTATYMWICPHFVESALLHCACRNPPAGSSTPSPMQC